MKKRKIKKGIFIKLGLLIVVIGIGIFTTKYLLYRGTMEFKLMELGYSKEEVKDIEKYLENKEITPLLEKEYDSNIVKIIDKKYFIYKNLDRYLEYLKNNEDKDLDEVIAIVNTNNDREFYTGIENVDTSKGNLMLVNKFYQLPESYVPENITPISTWYAYSNHSIIDEVNTKYVDMWNGAKKEGLTLIVTSSYRDYNFQATLYNGYKNSNGQAWADNYSARPGHSEHQLGLALDIVTHNNTMENFEQTDEFKWLEKNSYKYGFILRYPKGKEHITGFNYEPWHYRYVGIDIAKEIYELGITYDEYYAYYVK